MRKWHTLELTGKVFIQIICSCHWVGRYLPCKTQSRHMVMPSWIICSCFLNDITACYSPRSPKSTISQSNRKLKIAYLTLLENPLLRALCAQLLNILEHVKDDVLYVHWNQRILKEVYLNLYMCSNHRLKHHHAN